MKSLIKLLALTAGVSLLATATAQAATDYWAVGSGNWDLNTTANWTNSGTAGLVKFANGDTVFFDDLYSGTSPLLITNAAVFGPASITVNATNKNYTISGSGLGGTGLTKNGSGTLTIASTGNTNNGQLKVTGGNLIIGTGVANNSGPHVVNTSYNIANATLTLACGSALNFGFGSITITNATLAESATAFAGNNNPLGALTLQGATITTADGANGSSFQGLGLNGDVTVSGTTPSTISPTGDAGWNGVHLANNTAGTTRTFNVGVTAGSGPDLTISATLLNAVNGLQSVVLAKTGAGTLVLSGANLYSGGTSNNAGILEVDSNKALGTGLLSMNGGVLSNNVTSTLTNSINVISNSIVGVGASQTLTLGGVITNTGSLTKVGAGTLALTNANTYDGVTTISNGQVSIASSAALGSTVGNTVINDTGSTSTGGRLSISGSINIPENIFITGPGSSSGSAILNSGGVNTNSGLITLDTNAVYFFQIFAGTLNLNGGIIRSGTNVNTANMAASAGSFLNINNSPFNNNGGGLSIGQSFASGGTVFLGVAGNNFVPTIQYNNTLKMGATDAFTNSATLIIGAYISNGQTTAGQDAGILDLNGYNLTINGLFGAPNGTSNPSAGSNRVITNSSAISDSILTVGRNSGSVDFDGVIKDGATHKLSLTKLNGSGMTLRGANTYSGATTAWTPFIRPLVMRQFPVVSVCCFAATQGSGGRRA